MLVFDVLERELEDIVREGNDDEVVFCLFEEKYLLIASSGASERDPTYFELYEIGSGSVEYKQGFEVAAEDARVNSSSNPTCHGYVHGRSTHLIFSMELERRERNWDDSDWHADPHFYQGAVDYNFRTGELSLIQTDLGKVVCKSGN